MERTSRPEIPRKITLTIVSTGTIASVGFTLYAGRNNHSIFLMSLFVVWVFSPYIGIFFLNNISKHWSIMLQRNFCKMAIFITVCAVIGYSGIINIMVPMKNAFIFLIVPLFSWIVFITGAFLFKQSQNK